MLCTYELNSFAENLNKLKVDDDGITPMEKFSGTTADITLINHHTRGYKVYVLDKILQGNTVGLPKCEHQSR